LCYTRARFYAGLYEEKNFLKRSPIGLIKQINKKNRINIYRNYKEIVEEWDETTKGDSEGPCGYENIYKVTFS